MAEQEVISAKTAELTRIAYCTKERIVSGWRVAHGLAEDNSARK